MTHDQIEAMGMGDRIVVMNKGRVRQVGTPPEVYHDSADTFVATFLGSPGMNILDRGDFLVGFRPEQFVPKEIANRQQDLVTFPFEITRIEYLGADQLLYGKMEDTSDDSFIVSKLSSEIHLEIEAGNTYDFVIQQKQLRFFDKTNGTRIGPQPIQIIQE